MYITAEHLREQVIRPTLKYLGKWSANSETFLLNAACWLARATVPDAGVPSRL